jgi:hypothetical protein
VTKPRFDEKSTEFGIWLRRQKEIDSSSGFVTTNLDYVWYNYNTGFWMIIEEKRYMGKISWSQQKTFDLIINACKKDPNFCGFHLIQFEKTSPDDGRTFLDGKEVSKKGLINFLRFEE